MLSMDFFSRFVERVYLSERVHLPYDWTAIIQHISDWSRTNMCYRGITQIRHFILLLTILYCKLTRLTSVSLMPY